MTDIPSTPSWTTVPSNKYFCLKWHLKDKCFANCHQEATHASITNAAMFQKLAQWVENCKAINAPPAKQNKPNKNRYPYSKLLSTCSTPTIPLSTTDLLFAPAPLPSTFLHSVFCESNHFSTQSPKDKSSQNTNSNIAVGTPDLPHW